MNVVAAAPAPLSRDRIVSTAVEVADSAGLSEVSMRKVADRLGTGAMSLYRHVAGKDELLAAMVDTVIARYAPTDLDPSLGWRAQMHRLTRCDWQMYLEHPWVLPVTASVAPPFGSETLRSMELAMAALEPLGLTSREAARAVTTISTYVQGSAQVALGPDDRPAPEDPGTTWHGRLANADLSAFPLLRELVSAPAEPQGTAWLASGLDLILDGIESRGRRSPHLPG